jgi:HPr kinase/phosphorylase
MMLFPLTGTVSLTSVTSDSNLEDWNNDGDYERTALDEKTTTLLDAELPYVRIPINPGKNLTVISEVVALRHLLKVVGINPASTLNQRVLEVMKEGERVRYRREDYE